MLLQVSFPLVATRVLSALCNHRDFGCALGGRATHLPSMHVGTSGFEQAPAIGTFYLDRLWTPSI